MHQVPPPPPPHLRASPRMRVPRHKLAVTSPARSAVYDNCCRLFSVSRPLRSDKRTCPRVGRTFHNSYAAKNEREREGRDIINNRRRVGKTIEEDAYVYPTRGGGGGGRWLFILAVNIR